MPIIFTRDWHPENSQIFTINLPEQNLPWPKHCVQNTWGAEFYRFNEYRQYLTGQNVYIINKGDNEFQEEYSPRYKLLPIIQYLISFTYFVTGVASEFCVKATYMTLLDHNDYVYWVSDAIIPAFEDIRFGNCITTDEILDQFEI